MMRYYLLACTLPGNIEKEVIAVKRSLFKRSGLSSALALPPLVPLQWSLKLQSPEDIAFGPLFLKHGDFPGGIKGKGDEGPRFTAVSPRMEIGLWWLPVLPPPKVMQKGDVLCPYPGVPLVTAPSESSTSDLSHSSTLSSSTLSPGEESALKEIFQTIPPLTWKAMGLSCFVFSFSVFHFPGEIGDDEEPADNADSLNNEGPWNNTVFWERGVEWEEVWRFKKPVLPGEQY